MRRRICRMALVGIVLLTACGQQGIQVAETAGRTESDTVYEKMQEEQKKQKKSSPSPISEKETELSEVIEKLPTDSPEPSMEPDPESYDLQLVFIGDETFGQNPDGIPGCWPCACSREASCRQPRHNPSRRPEPSVTRYSDHAVLL